MTKNSLLIAFSSWEDRFRIGFERDLERTKVGRALVFFFDDYASKTHGNRIIVARHSKDRGIQHDEVQLKDIGHAAENWKDTLGAVEEAAASSDCTWVDITSMPREILWYIFWILEQQRVSVKYLYHSPKTYGDAWLSREPHSPRLVFKLSGVSYPSAKTALLVTVGFDLQRVKRLINWCEPSKLMVGVQSGSYFERNDSEMRNSAEALRKEYDCEIFDIDAYSSDHGLAAIEGALSAMDEPYNLLMSSLGPKLTAVTLYRLQRAHSNMGLVYAPARQYSPDYSRGIDQCYEGAL